MSGEERNWVLATYGLLLIAPGSGGITAVIGVILAYLRWDAARGSPYESHYRNLTLTFWVWLAAALILAAAALVGFAGTVLSLLTSPAEGYPFVHDLAILALWGLGWLLAGIWYYWRLLRGLIRALDDKPY